MMINVFYKNRHTIGQLVVALMFVSGSVFMFTFDGFVSESGAEGCCGGGEVKVASFASDSSGDYGSYVSIDAGATGCCGRNDNSVPSGSNSDGCGCVAATPGDCDCSSSDNCDGSKGCNNSQGGCCIDNDGYSDCNCSTQCGGKGPSKCDAESNPC